jgi:hypothetical protein
MYTKWHFHGLVSFSLSFGVVAITGCDEDHGDVNFGVIENGVVADDDHIDFTPVDDDITFRHIAENGIEPNGFRMNGFRMNGFRMNGFRMNGTVLNSIMRLGTTISNLQITSGSLLSAYDTGSSQTLMGAQLAGMVFSIGFDPLATGTDTPAKVKVKSVVQSSLQPSVYFYEVENEVSAGVFEVACLDGAGNPTDAIALRKAWDPATGERQELSDAITWACRGAALAKAIEWGYIPWESAAMEDAHQAAVRMIRADYCGTGEPHTSNGNPIDVSDKWNIQRADTTWDIEAKWGPNGAVCLNTPRKLYHPRSSLPCAAALPYCTSDGLATGTPNTDPSQYGGLLMTRAIPNSNY